MSDIILEVNGLRYVGFDNINVVKAIENLSGQFTFSTTVKEGYARETESGITYTTGPLSTIQNDLKVQDAVKVYIDDNLVLSGFIEDLTISYSVDSHSIVVAGRDKAGDLIDSSMIPASYSQRNLTRLVALALKENGHTDITVINDVENLPLLNPDSKGVIAKVEKGDSIASFLDRYAKRVQALITTDKNGDIVITREGSELAVGGLIHEIKGNNNNILSADINISTTERYRFFEMYSSSDNSNTSGATQSQVGIAIDPEIRATRRKRVSIPEATETSSLKGMAKWYVNVRKARGARYNCRVQGFYATGEGGFIWKPNTLVNIKDEKAQIEGEFLIQGVSFVRSLAGSFTDLSIVQKGAFSVQEPSKGKAAVDNSSLVDKLFKMAQDVLKIS